MLTNFFFATEASNPYFLSWLWSKPKYSTLALHFPPLIKRQPPRTNSIRISPQTTFLLPSSSWSSLSYNTTTYLRQPAWIRTYVRTAYRVVLHSKVTCYARPSLPSAAAAAAPSAATAAAMLQTCGKKWDKEDGFPPAMYGKLPLLPPAKTLPALSKF